VIDQRSADWHAQRAGKVTASRMGDVLAKSKKDGKPLQARRDYVTEKVVEILTGCVISTGTVPAMQHGIDCEPLARAAYEIKTGCLVDPAEFYTHPDLPYVGASPDGLIGTAGLLEIKCPFNMTVQLDTLTDGMPAEHMAQIQTQLWVTGRKWADFVSYDPRYPEHLRLYVQRIEANAKFHAILHEECEALWAEVHEKLQTLGGDRLVAVEGSAAAPFSTTPR
jgi:putative phage-type endonuclease